MDAPHALKLAKANRSTRTIQAAIYTLVVTALIYLAFSHWAYDDPFITYRYAYNLSHGQGLVYNFGQRVQSTTTPLFTMLLAGLSPLWSDLPHLANLIGAFSLALGAVFLWDLSRTWEAPLVGWAGLLLYPSFSLLVTSLGSETPLYLALGLGAFALYAREQYTWAGVFSALTVLTRPDGLLIPLLLAAHYLIRRRAGRPIPWAAVVVFLSLSAPWFLFAWSYYGSPLPATLAAKQHQGAMSISQRFAPGLLSLVRSYAGRWRYWLELALALVGLVFTVVRARRWMLLLAWTGLYFAAYTLLGVSSYYWYYAPLVPGWIVLIGLGVQGLKTVFERLIRYASARLPLAPASALAATLIIILAVLQASGLANLRQHPDTRLAAYRAVGVWLNEHTPPDASVGTLEVGIIGYYARRPMVDFAGLLQPRVAGQLSAQTTYADAARWAVHNYQPDYLVLQRGYFPELEKDFVAENCQLATTFPGNLFGFATDLDVYACPG
ncbi:MAG: glycosyltransferase family 87 protein [Anaerolineales bacterium]